MQDEILDLNLKLGIKAETERTLKESLSEAHNLSPSGLREMLKNLQIQLNNLTQIDRKTMDGSLLSNQGRNEREKFVKMLKAKHPNISDAEAHLAHYIRLKLNNKEIGLATGISNGSVRVYKSKLKSKIGIPNHDSLTEYLEKL
jgi:DNA-binding CsgD family transcriptional regulator